MFWGFPEPGPQAPSGAPSVRAPVRMRFAVVYTIYTHCRALLCIATVPCPPALLFRLSSQTCPLGAPATCCIAVLLGLCPTLVRHCGQGTRLASEGARRKIAADHCAARPPQPAGAFWYRGNQSPWVGGCVKSCAAVPHARGPAAFRWRGTLSVPVPTAFAQVTC